MMAKVTWKDAKPAPDPFAAVVGDLRQYAVHLCDVSDSTESEIGDIFVEFFRKVFDAALAVQNPKARRIVIEVDTVYAMITVVVTDEARSHDEREVFKLSMNDWDIGTDDDVNEDEEPDQEAERAAFQRVFDNFENATEQALADPRLTNLQSKLQSIGFQLWIMNHDEDAEGKPMKRLPLAGETSHGEKD